MTQPIMKAAVTKTINSRASRLITMAVTNPAFWLVGVGSVGEVSMTVVELEEVGVEVASEK